VLSRRPLPRFLGHQLRSSALWEPTARTRPTKMVVPSPLCPRARSRLPLVHALSRAKLTKRRPDRGRPYPRSRFIRPIPRLRTLCPRTVMRTLVVHRSLFGCPCQTPHHLCTRRDLRDLESNDYTPVHPSLFAMYSFRPLYSQSTVIAVIVAFLPMCMCGPQNFGLKFLGRLSRSRKNFSVT
jgi:hypothetical protein